MYVWTVIVYKLVVYSFSRMASSAHIEKLTRCLNNFHYKSGIKFGQDDNKCWIISHSKLDRVGIFAKRDIKAGEVLFYDDAILIGPKTKSASLVTDYKYDDCCIYCSNKLIDGKNQYCALCCMPVCIGCRKQNFHEHECKLLCKLVATKDRQSKMKIIPSLLNILAEVRALLLCDEYRELIYMLRFHSEIKSIEQLQNALQYFNFADEELKFIIRIRQAFNANAFEIPNHHTKVALRGLYPLASLANHSCQPNATHLFDMKNKRMIVKSITRIDKGSEIFHMYCPMLWSTSTRQQFLLDTKYFRCNCTRCLDPTELGTYLGALVCKQCSENVLYNFMPSDDCMLWKCEQCQQNVSKNKVGDTLKMLASLVNSFDRNSVHIMIRAIKFHLPKLLAPSHEVIIQLKLQLIWIIGHHTGFQWSEISKELLSDKIKFCTDILEVLKKLHASATTLSERIQNELQLSLQEQLVKTAVRGDSEVINEEDAA